MTEARRWLPGGLLAIGCILNFAVAPNRSRSMPLAAPIESISREFGGFTGADLTVSEDERRVAGMSAYVLRTFGPDSAPPAFTIYVGYYPEQTQGRTIHSPRNCLPGAGWEPVVSGSLTIATAFGGVTVNRYELVRGGARVLVYYWYQGRGRVANNEYRVKYELLRDAALHGRTEEALVRVVVPVTGSVAEADSVARRVAVPLVAEVARILPSFP
jgi:EpsI family protein